MRLQDSMKMKAPDRTTLMIEDNSSDTSCDESSGTIEDEMKHLSKQAPLIFPTTSSGWSDSSSPRTSITPLTGGFPSPAPEPVAWLWSCHLCKHRYPLGATRRCLIDGHYYCSGQQLVKKKGLKKRKTKHCEPCSSEFDYASWIKVAKWKQEILGIPKYSDCRQCVFPSQCRHLRAGIENKHAAIGVAVSTDIPVPKKETTRSMSVQEKFDPSETIERMNRIERIMEAAEKRNATLKSLTSVETGPKVPKTSNLVQQYIMPVIDFVNYKT